MRVRLRGAMAAQSTRADAVPVKTSTPSWFFVATSRSTVATPVAHLDRA